MVEHVNSPDIQDEILKLKAGQCQIDNTSIPGWCQKTWDGILCWSATAPGETAALGCPQYIAGFNAEANATRECMSDGTWFWNAEAKSTWSNYSLCYNTDTNLGEILIGAIGDNITLSKKYDYVPVVMTISKIGYTVSLMALIVAFCILATMKKLRCPRNILHMHLFASFMARAFMAPLRSVLFVPGAGLASDHGRIVRASHYAYWEDSFESNWECKLFTSFWQYFILANYSWILMEGLYLHNLVFLALFTDSSSSIAGYIVLGWGLPAIFVLPWVALRAALDDQLCWFTNPNQLLFLVIRIPTVLSILINFVLFVNIVRVLLLKLQSTVSEETKRYKRWARSTLVLVPLFGVHYMVFLGMTYSIGGNETVEVIWLFCDQLFASFQGFFVAVLYCFLNGEVRAELSRAWRSRRWARFRASRWGPRASTHSSSNCTCNAAKFSKKTTASRWWDETWACCRERDASHSTHSMASTQDAGTRGGSLASSRGYLEVVGTGVAQESQITNHTSPLCSKYTDQSLLSFCSNMSEMSVCGTGLAEKTDRIRGQHRWSDSECCHLAYELQSLQHHHTHP